MYDTLLFLHVMGAFITFITVVIFSAYAFGMTASRGSFVLADWAWNISGTMLIVFGIWLALYVDGYEIWDGWILGALVLFSVATETGRRARLAIMSDFEGATHDELTPADVTLWHWLRTAAIVAILVLMVWKPGA